MSFCLHRLVADRISIWVIDSPGMPMQTAHSIRLTFSNATTVSGAWTKQYNGCVMLSCIDCNCVAGGSTNGTFSGFKIKDCNPASARPAESPSSVPA